MSKVCFILIVASTELVKHPGISAAGANHRELALTSARDAEYIYSGNTTLPVSPSGIVSPALISKACLDLLGYDIKIVDAGSIIPPQCPHESLADFFASDPCTENAAIDFQKAEKLYQKAFDFAQNSFNNYQELIIAESVVAGTTTALGLLTALGHSCFDMVSSSIPQGNHQLKNQIIKKAWSQNTLSSQEIKQNPILAAASMGDGMQIVACAFMQTFQGRVTLAGGSQMLAVKALSDAVSVKKDLVLSPSPWIIDDKSASFLNLVEKISPQTKLEYIKRKDVLLLDSLNQAIQNPKFSTIVENYNQGHVKEGVGMGAMLKRCHVALSRGRFENMQ